MSTQPHFTWCVCRREKPKKMLNSCNSVTEIVNPLLMVWFAYKGHIEESVLRLHGSKPVKKTPCCTFKNIGFNYCQDLGRWVHWGRSCQHNSWPHILFQPVGGRGSLARQLNPTYGTVSGTEKDHIWLSFFLPLTALQYGNVSSLSCGDVHIPTTRRLSWSRTPCCVSKAANNGVLSGGSGDSDLWHHCYFRFPV